MPIRDVKTLNPMKSHSATKLSADAKAFFPGKTSSRDKQNPNRSALFPPPLPYHQQHYIPPPMFYHRTSCPTPVNPQLQCVQFPPFYYVPPNPEIMIDQGLTVNPWAPLPPQDLLVLRSNIVRQIEYYFSDKNLKKDHYLISIMDDQGWVSISTIAEFKRLKNMCTDIPFILDSLLLGSTSVEVQGYKIRPRDNWLKWIPAHADSTVTSKQHIQPEQLRSANNRDKIVDASSDGKYSTDLLLSSTGHGTADSVLDGGSLVFTADN
ncbi:la-related protein 1A-like [Pyrus x bretschneideri]|uniref:la-related protein 1A-like n=1 Tax=Pyrus x bretschneideri TaxID=225117 RepID=UPI00202F42CC|nr:la-related protein 1A-like [Pyrus x bretschneideri]